MNRWLLYYAMGSLALGVGCKNSPSPTPESGADLLLTAATIYTLNDSLPAVSAVAVKNGEIIALGSRAELDAYIGAETKIFDAGEGIITPGWIDSHAHLMGIGKLKAELDLSDVESYDGLVGRVASAVARAEPGQWIVGRGWHQSKWAGDKTNWVRGFPTHEALSAVSPQNPVYLVHASGHASMANAAAMRAAEVTLETTWGSDGEVIRRLDGRATGVFTELAANLIENQVPEPDETARRKWLQAGLKSCIESGITSLHDAGIDSATLALYRAYHESDTLPIRLYTMLSGADTALVSAWMKRRPQLNPWLTVRSIKLYADGALGSRGAWLLQPYRDRPGHVGNALQPTENIEQIARIGLEHGYQVCTHAIGDRANREVLNAYAAAFAAHPDAASDARFRIEHAQHIDPEDIPRFAGLGVIASIQGIHHASDRPWAAERLGMARILAGAYPWQKLLQAGAVVVNGTDAPVEPIDPVACFYATITRKTLAGEPEGGYEADQRMSREEALQSYTREAAFAAFQEKKKGTIEVGKWADFTVFSQDIMSVPEERLLETEVVATIVGGRIVYQR